MRKKRIEYVRVYNSKTENVNFYRRCPVIENLLMLYALSIEESKNILGI